MGKPSAPVIGFWYRPAFHIVLTPQTIDAFLGFYGGDKLAWQGLLTSNGTANVNAPNLWGGEKDQGGIVGDLDVMFGESDQLPNAYLTEVFGDQTVAWRGCTTVAWKGGRYGAMNPYPQKPGFVFRRIKAGWDNGCWYPEKAEIPVTSPGLGTLPESADGWEYVQIADEVGPGYNNLTPPESGWAAGIGPFGSGVAIPRAVNTNWTVHTVLWIRRSIDFGAGGNTLKVQCENGALVFCDGALVGSLNPENIDLGSVPTIEVAIGGGTHLIEIKAFDEVPSGPSTVFLGAWIDTDGATAIYANPAHVIYESLIDSEMDREPVENIDDASFRAGADKFHAAGFGICPKRNPQQESTADFRARIGRLAGCSATRSVTDGKWYLDLAWGPDDIDALPIITDDDILSFKKAPTTLDGAVNSVGVKYHDAVTFADVVTPPTRSLSLVAKFGTIHQTNEYPEIPTGDLAARVALRDMLASTTPTTAFDLVCKPTIYALRPNQYFRLQAPKRGIADMVCLVGQIEHGSLKSGAIKLKAAQDTYRMAETSFVQVEPGVDTRPPQTPNAIVLERAIEAPYVEVAGALPRAELDALPADAGFAMAMAAAPAGELDFTVMVDAGAGYADQGTGHWCATATVNESASRTATSFTLANAKLLGNVTVGMGALWDDEWARVDAIDADALTITLGRGCADTTPQLHAASRRLFFYEVGFGYDSTEYTVGETIAMKLLSRTGSQLLAIGSATPMEIEFAQRQARPYPPAKLRINDAAEPGYLFGALTVEWVHRDRLLQADQLVDTEAAGIGPEAGTTYTMRTYLDGVLDDTQTGIAGTSATVTPSGDGVVRIEVESERDSLVSWQANTREFSYTADEREPLLLAGEVLTILGEHVYME